MSREELKEIVTRVIVTLRQDNDETPRPACFYGDNPDPDPCDVTTFYGINEEG